MSWFYYYVKKALADNYDVYLEKSFTEPGDFFCKGGCDSIVFPKDNRDEYYLCEIKSIDENPKSWLSHPNNEEKNNPEQFEVRDYWIKQNENNTDNTINPEVFAWAFVITGQLEQYFLRDCCLKYKTHKKNPTVEIPNIPVLPTNKRRTLIFDSYYKKPIQETIKILDLKIDNFEEIHDKKYSWLTVCILKFNKPAPDTIHRWFNKY